MNIFNLGRKYEELRLEVDALKAQNAKLIERVESAEAFSNKVHAYYADFVTDHGRIEDSEKAVIEMNAAHAEEIKEIRERLDMPRRSKSTMRPWAALRSVAEAGERKAAEKLAEKTIA